MKLFPWFKVAAVIFSAGFFSGCNTLHKLTSAEDHPNEVQTLPSDYTVTGTAQTNNETIKVRTKDSQIKVRSKVIQSEEWKELNKYEYKVGADEVVFGKEVTINPGGSITFQVPAVPVIPVGTQFEVRSVLLETSRSLY